MRHIDVDIETFSDVNLKKTGVTYYAQQPGTGIRCVCYHISGCEENDVRTWLPGMPVPDCFKEPYVMVAHNAAFERAIFRYILEPLGFGAPSRVICTMIAAYQRNLPGSLDDAAGVLGLGCKDNEGSNIMRKMMHHGYEYKVHAAWKRKTRRKKDPVNPTVAWFSAEAEMYNDLQALILYCKQDVLLEMGISAAIKMKEFKLYQLADKINARGIGVDALTVQKILKLVDQEVAGLNSQIKELTEGKVHTGKQVGKLLEWLRERGYQGEGVGADAISEGLANPEGIAPEAIEVMKIRQKTGIGSVGKYKAMMEGLTYQSRIHDLIQFRGAAQTGRYAGRRIQPQNLPRLVLGDKEIALAIRLFRDEDDALLRLYFGSVIWTAKQLIRPMFVCPQGMIVSDFAQIEARCLAWMCNQKDALESFADPDRDPYIEMASKIYKTPLDSVTDDQRFVGKTCVLGAGYGLGGLRFAEQVCQRGGNITEDEGYEAITAFRNANPHVVDFWYRTHDRMVDVIRNPGSYQPVGWNMEMQSFDLEGQVGVTIELPSGRRLFYHDCKIFDGKYGPAISFIGADAVRVETYGGKVTENICQAIANDVLNYALLNLDDAGYEIVLHVHDEVVIQNIDPSIDVDKIRGIMEQVPSWADGLPLEAETKNCGLRRYTK